MSAFFSYPASLASPESKIKELIKIFSNNEFYINWRILSLLIDIDTQRISGSGVRFDENQDI
jgi:hypothetical protein